VTAATNWTAISAVLVGIGAVATAVMAFATFRVASKTEEMATAATKEAKAVEDQLRASVQPWLTWLPSVDSNPVDVPGVRLLQGGNGIRGFLSVYNVGNGLAIVNTGASWVIGEHDDYSVDKQYVTLQTQSPIVAQGGVTTLTFLIPTASSAWTELDIDTFARRRNSNGHFLIDVVYTDAVHQNSTRARFKIAAQSAESSEWNVHQIDYISRNNDGEYGVSVRF
jgi:hypothetical protein